MQSRSTRGDGVLSAQTPRLDHSVHPPIYQRVISTSNAVISLSRHRGGLGTHLNRNNGPESPAFQLETVPLSVALINEDPLPQTGSRQHLFPQYTHTPLSQSTPHTLSVACAQAGQRAERRTISIHLHLHWLHIHIFYVTVSQQ